MTECESCGGSRYKYCSDQCRYYRTEYREVDLAEQISRKRHGKLRTPTQPVFVFHGEVEEP